MGIQTSGPSGLNLKKSQHLGYSTPYNTRSHIQVVYMGSYFPSPFFMFASWYNIFFYIKKNRRSFSSPDLHAPLRAPENFSGDRYFDVISTLSFSFVSLQNTKGNQKRAISVHILVYHPKPGKRSSSFLAGLLAQRRSAIIQQMVAPRHWPLGQAPRPII